MKLHRNRPILIWLSYRSLPIWVQIWVGLILIPANTLGFLFMDTFSGHWIALAAVMIVFTNGPLIWFYSGMNKALSIPHLFIWLPLHIILVGRLAGYWGTSPISFDEGLLDATVLTVNSISLVFDVADSWHWLQGKRNTPGISKADDPKHRVY